jgi:hypothetical protein
MTGSLNKVILIGNLGADPAVNSLESGGPSAACGWRQRQHGGIEPPVSGEIARNGTMSHLLGTPHRLCRASPAQKRKGLHRR